MIIENNNRKVELKNIEGSDNTSIDFYTDNKLLMSLIVAEDYSQLKQDVLISRAYIQIATQFLYEGLHDDIFSSIYDKFVLDDAYWENSRNKQLLFIWLALRIIVPLSDDSLMKLELNLKSDLLKVSVKKTIGENELILYSTVDISVPFTTLKEVSFIDLFFDDNTELYMNKEKIKINTQGFDFENYKVIHDYNIDFAIPYELFYDMIDADYIESINFFEAGHLFIFTKEQMVECAKRKLACNDDFYVVIKAVNPDGTVEF